jgi:DNA-binding CsgD family transcriptional regulator
MAEPMASVAVAVAAHRPERRGASSPAPVARRREVADGCPLTPTELRCMALIAVGFTRQETAGVLGIRITTLRQHLHNGRRRLGAGTVEQAILEVALRWVQTPRSGIQHYLDEFDQRLGAVRQRKTGQRQPAYPELDDLIHGVLAAEADHPPPDAIPRPTRNVGRTRAGR